MLLALGDFRFSINTCAYQQLKQTSSYNWHTQNTIGGRPIHQCTGASPETIELEGVIYPHYKGGLHQIQNMRNQANRMQPLTMVSGNGDVLGRWVIKQVEETSSNFTSNGKAQKLTFRLQLEKFDR